MVAAACAGGTVAIGGRFNGLALVHAYNARHSNNPVARIRYMGAEDTCGVAWWFKLVWIMGYIDKFQRYLDSRVIGARLITTELDTPTVPAAAVALGVTPDQIVKTLVFAVDSVRLPEHYVVVISYGERRVDKSLLGGLFQVGKKRVGMAPPEKVLELIGYPVGGVSPFGHEVVLPVLMDIELTKRSVSSVIYAGGGDHHTMLELTVEELLRVSQPRLEQICASWSI